MPPLLYVGKEATAMITATAASLAARRRAFGGDTNPLRRGRPPLRPPRPTRASPVQMCAAMGYRGSRVKHRADPCKGVKQGMRVRIPAIRRFVNLCFTDQLLMKGNTHRLVGINLHSTRFEPSLRGCLADLVVWDWQEGRAIQASCRPPRV